MSLRARIPVETLRKLLHLDAMTGQLYWRQRGIEWFRDGKQSAAHNCAAWNGRYAGKEALAAINGEGYRNGPILANYCLTHRVVFALANGRWPDGEVDHIDGDRSNNCPSNLREATRQQNMRNRGKPSSRQRRSTSSYCGVTWNREMGKWRAQGKISSSTSRHLGYFQTEVEAAIAYDKFVREHHGAFAKTNF